MTSILVVDDSAVDRRLAGGLLEKTLDATIYYAEDGVDALEQIELHIPDIVLTDMQMPNMDGLELVKQVKTLYPLIPVVLMTAQGSEEIAVKALHCGAVSYVPKRKLAQDLMEIINRVTSASQQDRSDTRLARKITSLDTSYVLENELPLISSLVNHLQKTIIRMGVCGQSERIQVGIAIEEALVNAFYHGNLELEAELREKDHKAFYALAQERTKQSPYQDRRIHVRVQMTRGQAIFTIRDEGPGFDPALLPDPTDAANLEKPGGRGVMLMQAFADEVTYNDKGNEVTLIKSREPEDSVELAEGQE
ncbi:Chemotaxis protein CheY [Symmachiella dynata]|uniref:Chemotaxis protein CheY n=1 Tax=Symmachiella dynata TaxID=2527995 RepID=A0A517ZM16_9PLAN|nr:response regulator [Symmachiella dynata]QDU43514.1 Chemotaxis protein CheY [Symmachiella dynata]